VSCADGANGSSVRTLLCAGIAVLDHVFRLDRFPAPQAKARASAFAAVGGGCAANAAVAAARARRTEITALLDGQISA
jgi:sulfofructose kinase